METQERGQNMFFDKVEEGQPDAIFGLSAAFAADVRPQKVDLLVGIYKDEHLRSELLPSVRRAKEQIIGQDILADYLPIDGDPEFLEGIKALIFCGDALKEAHGRIYGAHTAGGTVALRIGAEFLAQEVTKAIFIPNPTWPNHRSIFERAGCKVDTYPYYSREKQNFDLDAMAEKLEKIPEKSAILLHACCHNPTGCDPSLQEWKEISLLMRDKKLVPFFDFAYQGLGDGIEKDAAAVRMFLEDGHEMLIAYSCSKNFSLYCQRVGGLFVSCDTNSVKFRVGSQVKRIIRALYSNPPAHGARIVREILKRDDLRALWEKDLQAVHHRITLMRESFTQRLISHSKKVNFQHLRNHKGMFSYLGIDGAKSRQMIEQFAIYIQESGRINVAGLTFKNLDYVADSLLKVCEA
jgi:aspartate/tyrosine/aromatic aminotransferase